MLQTHIERKGMPLTPEQRKRMLEDGFAVVQQEQQDHNQMMAEHKHQLRLDAVRTYNNIMRTFDQLQWRSFSVTGYISFKYYEYSEKQVITRHYRRHSCQV